MFWLGWLAWSLLSPVAQAADALSMSAVQTVQVGGTPSMTFQSTIDGAIEATLTCAGQRFSLTTDIAPGGAYTLELPGLPEGQHACQGQLSLRSADGGVGEMPLSLQVALLPPLELTAGLDDVDLEGRRVRVQANRPLAALEVEVLGEGGSRIGLGSVTDVNHTVATAPWDGPGGEVLKLLVTATDTHGYRSRLELTPWSYAIPHEDVVFASGQATLEASELPKLEAAWAEVQAVLAKYGDIIDIRLYVAGYTDTVGPASTNQALSERRAKAIAAWFRERGFTGPVAYQGFGEDGLAVPTGDEVDQAANRRAMYLLTAGPPPIHRELPRGNWRAVP